MSENATLELALRKAPEAVMLTPPQIMVIAQTEFVPKSMRGNVPKVLACIARGRAMGIPDMVAVNGIDIIEGKASLSAELMVAIVREHGHSITGDVTAQGAVVRGRRRDNGDQMSAEFTHEMAVAAGLAGKQNYKKHPDDMMWARAVSKLCRRLFADCFAGGTYAPDDLLPTADETHDEVSLSLEPFVEPIPDEADEITDPSPLDLLIATHGRDKVAGAYRELFPKGSRGEGPLSEDEVVMLADELSSTKATVQ